MRKILPDCSSNIQMTKKIQYLVDTCLKWLSRILENQQCTEQINGEIACQEELQSVFTELHSSVNICLQKLLDVLCTNPEVGQNVLLKYLLLFRDIHSIIPNYGVANEINIDCNFSEKESQEKKLFCLNIIRIYADSIILPHQESKQVDVSIERLQNLGDILTTLVKNI